MQKNYKLQPVRLDPAVNKME